MRLETFVSIIACVVGFAAVGDAASPDKQPLTTRWAAEVTADNCWQQYPRPQLTRTDWMCLNGLWDFALLPAAAHQPDRFDKKILVPFPVESYLSRVTSKVEPDQRMWYRRTFAPQAKWKGNRLLLHFGAVDWDAQVWVNGVEVGRHQGGYDPFSFDVTEHINWSGDNELIVAASDPTDKGTQPHGKQQQVPEGIRYTPTSGIWQTVWLEPAPERAIERLKITPDANAKSVTIEASVRGAEDSQRVEVEVINSGAVVARGETLPGKPMTLAIPGAELWSPAHPHLYDLRIRLNEKENTIDEVGSYFGLRSIALGKDKNGLIRMMLNGEPVFQLGVLDQGYWPDGLYAPPSDEAMQYDLKVAKELGFNLIRKHVKVEPARWYYWCDKLGLLVWQDMPSGDAKGPWPHDGTEMVRSGQSADQFRKELKAMVDFCHNFPCVVVWIPFNEAWGQFDTREVVAWLRQYDPSRLVIAASGGNDLGVGDVDDDHFYPGPGGPPAERRRAAVLGEFGGLGLPLQGHTWQDDANWGYRSFTGADDLEVAYVGLVEKLRPLVESHLSAAVYTQLTDVEIEVNGLLTYDREILKCDAKTLHAAHQELFAPIPDMSQQRRLGASTLAWWRFEKGEPGQSLPNIADNKGAIGVRDVSGHNNHLFAFSGRTAPLLGKVSFESELAPHYGNTKQCLDDTRESAGTGLVRDLFTDPNLALTHMNVLNNYPFTEWTVEASFAFSELGERQAIISKQGRNGESPYPPLQLGVFDDNNAIQLQIIDESGQYRSVASKHEVKAGIWYHVAATCDGSTLRLYLREDGASDYELQSEQKVSGSLLRSEGTWTLGRGFYDDRIEYDARALIDEVRISTIARPQREFLFAR